MTGDPRPVWLLDVDGVINAIALQPEADSWPAPAWTHRLVTALDGRTWPILSAQPVLDFLIAVDRADRAEIRWHTTWQQSAVERLGPALGLPSWPIATAPEFTDFDDSGYAGRMAGPRWWKAGAAQRVRTEEQRRLIWTDDDLWAGRALPVVKHLMSDVLVCTVSPLPATGLTAADLAHIDLFLSRSAQTGSTQAGDGPA